MFEFGSRVGFWRIWRMFTRHGLPLTVYAVGQALERNPAAAKAMVEAGWEVASHGWRWIDYAGMPEDEEREHMRRAIDAIERVCGARPVGWYTGRTSENTRRLVVEEGGFLYDSDSYADELPYWVEVAGGQHLVIPYTLDANDFKFLLPNGFVTADDFFAYLVDTFEQLYEEGGRMMNVGLHCRIVGRPGRAPGLDRFLEHVREREGVWVTTRAEIARHWREQFAPEGAVVPELVPAAADAVPGDVAGQPLGVDLREQPGHLGVPALRARRRGLVRRREELLEALLAPLTAVLVDRHVVRV